MTQSISHIRLQATLVFFPFVHAFYCPQRTPRIFYSLTFTISSPSPSETPQSPLMPALQSQHRCQRQVYYKLILSISCRKKRFLPREAMLSAVYAVVVCLCVCLSVCVSVCLSVTLRYCIKTAKRRIKQTTPHDSIFRRK